MTDNLISREHSTILKGFLILLIILGHLRGISENFQDYLYSFHVQCFFILPFLYPSKKYNFTYIKNLFLKLYWPDWLFYTLFILLSIFILKDSAFVSKKNLIPGVNNILLGLWSYITGGMSLINKYCGVIFLWFLPCFFSLSLIRSWFYNKVRSEFVKTFFLFIGLICFFIFNVLLLRNGFLPKSFFYIAYAVSPFSILQGIGYFSLGYFSLHFIRFISNYESAKYYLWGGVITTILLYFFFNKNQLIFRLLRFISPTLYFTFFYFFIEYLSKFRIFNIFGKYSLSIYLIHPIICIAIEMVVPIYILQNVFSLVIEFLFVTSISLMISILIERIKLLRMFIFPKGEEIGREYKKLFHR